jgi:drug/metabolite transporter (DMT)-like permease
MFVVPLSPHPLTPSIRTACRAVPPTPFGYPVSANTKAGQGMVFYLPILLMILGTTTYHIAQKSVPTQLNPLFSLTVNYLTALVGTVLLFPLYPSRTSGPWTWRGLNWASAAVGISIVAVELSVLLAYRTGWHLSILSTLGNTASALLLVVIGLVFFREHLTAGNLAGIILCLVGLGLITRH